LSDSTFFRLFKNNHHFYSNHFLQSLHEIPTLPFFLPYWFPLVRTPLASAFQIHFPLEKHPNNCCLAFVTFTLDLAQKDDVKRGHARPSQQRMRFANQHSIENVERPDEWRTYYIGGHANHCYHPNDRTLERNPFIHRRYGRVGKNRLHDFLGQLKQESFKSKGSLSLKEPGENRQSPLPGPSPNHGHHSTVSRYIRFG